MSNDVLLKKIFAKTDGRCHICHRKLSFQNYGKQGATGSWHKEHSVPKAKGGTDHLNNLFAACIECNVEKGTLTSRTARSYNGNARAPYSKQKKKELKENNTATGVFVGGGIGFAIGGPIGMLIGATLGGAIGNNNSPNK